MKVFREILQICPRILNQDFIAPPSEEELVTFIQELSYSGKFDMLSAIHTNQMHQPWRTTTIINRCISGKTTRLDRPGNHKLKSYGYGALVPDDMINQAIKDSKAYKTYYDFAIGKATPKKARKYNKVASPTRKLSPVLEEEPTKAPPKGDRGKYIELLFDATLLEAAQVLYESQYKKTGTNEGTGTKPRVPDVPKYLSESKNESWGDSGNDKSNDDHSDEVTKDDVKSDANEDKEASDSEKIDFDDDENLNDVNVRSKVTEHEEVGKGDAEMIDTTHERCSKEKSYEQVIKDAHMTLTYSYKTKGSKQSFSVSSNFASKFLNLDNVLPVIDEVAYLMNVKTPHEELSNQAPPILSVPMTAIPKTSTVHATIKSVTEIIKDEVKSQLPQILPKENSDFAILVIQSTINESLENVVLAKSYSQPQSTYEDTTYLTEFDLKMSMLDKLEKSKSYQAAKQHKDLYDALVKSYQLEKDLFDSYGKAYSLKRDRKDKDKDEDPSADQTKGSKSQTKSSGKSAQAEEPVFETADTEMPQDQGDDLGNTEDQPNVNEASKHDWWKKPERPLTPDQCYKAVTDKLDWTNPEGHEYPFDLSKPLPLIKDQCHQVVPANYFFNNDLEYLKGRSLRSKYTTSTTKTKAANYDIIDGISHSGLKRQSFYGFASNRKSKHDVFSTTRIIAVTHVKVVKKYDYGPLSSIRRVLHDIASILEMDYLPKRRLRKLDTKRCHIMIKAIDQQLFERRLMRNLEKFIGGRGYENDFRLLERII
nr:hypothetical protein [Tanacetum cinerariifolium]